MSPYLAVVDVHKDVLTGQEGVSGQTDSVGVTCYPLI